MTRPLHTLAALLLSPLLLSPLLLASPAQASDAVTQLAAGVPIGSHNVRIALWTSAASATQDRVELSILPPSGSAQDASAPAGVQAVVSHSVAQRQVWEARGLALDAPGRGTLAQARVTLLDASGQPMTPQAIALSMTAGALTCGQDGHFGSFGTVHAHLRPGRDGQAGTLSLVVSGPDTDRIAAVQVQLVDDPSSASGSPSSSASLAQVQQLWIADLPVASAAGRHIQVDGAVIDQQGEPYGLSFAAELVVNSRPPAVSAPCPYGHDHGMWVAAR